MLLQIYYIYGYRYQKLGVILKVMLIRLFVKYICDF